MPISPRHDESLPGARIRYMGNKAALADSVARVIAREAGNRVLIDLFGGMCNVAGAVSSTGRRAWVNDAQAYAALAGRCLVASCSNPPTRAAVAALKPTFLANRAQLEARFGQALESEDRALELGRQEDLLAVDGLWRTPADSDQLAGEFRELARSPTVAPYRLITLAYACGYFGLRQAMALDSIRFAIDQLADKGGATVQDADWLRLAWLQTASRVAATPGHFAQFLRPTPTAWPRVATARRRDVWREFEHDVLTLRPYGTPRWRRRNRVFCTDAQHLWGELDAARPGPAVFYADPPYTKEHYSRYYHVLETMELYDYPRIEGAGRYRQERFTSGFAVKSRVLAEISALLSRVAERGDQFVLSYPSSGLLTAGLGIDPGALLAEHFSEVELVISQDARHSTLGGRHGASSKGVREYVWSAR